MKAAGKVPECERCGNDAKFIVTVRAAVTLKDIPLCKRCTGTMLRKYRASDAQEIADERVTF